MAGPGFGDLRVMESANGPSADVPEDSGPYISDPKVQRVLELLPKLRDPASRARAVVWLRTRGLDVSKEAGIDASPLDRRPAATAVTMSEEADRLSAIYSPAVVARLRSGDLGALDELRPADRADVQKKIAQRTVAGMNPTEHAPMRDRPGDLAGELDARAAEQAPVTRARGGQPKQEYTHTLGERAAAAAAQPISGAVAGVSRGATGGLATLPARAIAPEGQAMVDELADTSAVTTPATIASGLLPMGLGSRVAGVAAAAIPEAPAVGGLLGTGLRGAVGLGRAVVGGAAASAADATGGALNEMQQGVPAGEALSAVPNAMASSVPASIAMYPFFAGLQKMGRSAVEDLRRSPDIGPEVLALEGAGLGTRVPLLNREASLRAIQSEAPAPTRPGRLPFTRVKGAEPEGNEIAAAQREQQATGRPAATITGERAGKKVLGAMANEREEMLSRHSFENQQAYRRLEGQRASAEPVAKHISDLLKRGKFDDGTALPGKAEDNRDLARQLESVATVRWAKPGEQGIPPEAVEAFGLKVPAAAARDGGGTIPPPGKARRSRGLIIEAREMSPQQLEESIEAFDQIASAARNVEKSQSEKAARGISAALREMRQSFDMGYVNPGAITERFDPESGALGPDQGYARIKARHGEEQVAFRDKLKELGLAERVEKLRPEDANQLRTVVNKIMGGDPALQKLFPNDPEAQRELRVAAAHAAFDRLYGTATAGKPNMVVGPSGPHGILTAGGSARLAFDPIARGLAGTDLSADAQRGLTGSRSGRAAAVVPPETVNQFLAMIGLGGTEEDLK